MNPIVRNATILTSALVAATFAPKAQAASDWDWLVAPYLWAPSISTDLRTTTPPNGGLASDVDFSDIIDKIEGAFEIHIEGQGEQFGVLADFTYIGLGDSRNFTRFNSKSDLDSILLDAAVVWSPGAGSYAGWELFGGLRYIDIDGSLRLDPVNPAIPSTTIDFGDSYTDFLLGTRYLWKLSDRWGMALRADTSFGDTEGTWSASATASYATTHGAWLFGYRHMSVEFETGSSNTDLILSGLQVGYGFKF